MGGGSCRKQSNTSPELKYFSLLPQQFILAFGTFRALGVIEKTKLRHVYHPLPKCQTFRSCRPKKQRLNWVCLFSPNPSSLLLTAAHNKNKQKSGYKQNSAPLVESYIINMFRRFKLKLFNNPSGQH